MVVHFINALNANIINGGNTFYECINFNILSKSEKIDIMTAEFQETSDECQDCPNLRFKNNKFK